MAVVNITLDVLRCLRCVRYSYTMFGVKRYSSHQLIGCRYSHYTVLLFMCCSRFHLMRTSTSVCLSLCLLHIFLWGAQACSCRRAATCKTVGGHPVPLGVLNLSGVCPAMTRVRQ